MKENEERLLKYMIDKGMNLRISVKDGKSLAEYHQEKNGSSMIFDYLASGKDISLYRLCIRKFIGLRREGKMNEMQVDGYPVKIKEGKLIIYDDSTGEEGPAVPNEVEEMILES